MNPAIRATEFNSRCRTVGDGPAVLLLHGWMVTSRVWDRLLPPLAGHRLVLPDLPLQADARELDDYVTGLAGLCTAMDLHDAHLVGHSMGGQLAALLAAREPARFRTLTLLNPVPVDGLPFPEELQALFRECGGDRERQAQIVDMSSPGIDGAGRQAMLDDAAAVDPAIVRSGFDAFRRGAPGVSLAAVRMPATVVATDDPFLPPAFLEQAVVAGLPDARLVYLPGAGHYPQVERPAETAALLRDVLR